MSVPPDARVGVLATFRRLLDRARASSYFARGSVESPGEASCLNVYHEDYQPYGHRGLAESRRGTHGFAVAQVWPLSTSLRESSLTKYAGGGYKPIIISV